MLYISCWRRMKPRRGRIPCCTSRRIRGLRRRTICIIAEDEAFYVLEGGVTVVHDGKTIEAGAGSYIFLERGVPHGFRNPAGTRRRGC